MTLVVGARSPVGVTLYADWRLTREEAIRPPSFSAGALKLWILRPDLCVGYAGNHEVAQDVLRTAHDTDLSDLDSTLGLLRDEHRRSVPGGLDFVVAALGEPGGLFELRDGDIRARDVAWIGDYDAFRELQRFRDAARESATQGVGIRADWQAVSEIGQAFDHLVREASVPSVGELVLSVATGASGFIYAPTAMMIAGLTPQTIPSGVDTPINFGTAATGGFSYTVCGAENEPAVGVYFPHGRIGYFFHPRQFPEPRKYVGVSQAKFTEAVRCDTGVTLNTGVGIH